MLRIPKGWFKRRSSSGAVPEKKPEAVNGVEFGFKLSRRFGLNLARQKAAFVQIG